MEIIEIKENKKQFLPLLLLADEQESMIDRYIDRGMMYVLVDNGVKCECVVTDEGKGILEIKNIATAPEYQGKGYGKALIDFVAAKYKGKYSILQMYSKAQLKISLCEPSPQSDRHFCHCADNAAIYVHVHHCLVVERQL